MFSRFRGDGVADFERTGLCRPANLLTVSNDLAPVLVDSWYGVKLQALLVLLLASADSLRVFQRTSRPSKPTREASSELLSRLKFGGSEEYAFNLAAFFDGRRTLVRIFTELEPKYVTPIGTGDLHLPHVNQCFFKSSNGSTWSTKTLQVDTQWAYGDEERIRTINKVVAYTVDCLSSGVDATFVAPQLSSGPVLGQPVAVESMETKRRGRLAACSQPLFTQMAGIKDWVDYHQRLGVDTFHMHVPVGPHIDALFDEKAREKRIKETIKLNERSPESVGLERLQKFDHPAVVWQEYYGAPTANYYSETPLFNACVYRFRYAYDFVMLYDCDEWFTLRRQPVTRQVARSIPEFLDRHLPPHVASLQLDSFAFPAQCAISDHGEFPSRFTLRKASIWENMQKLIVRPLAVACTAIHGIFDITEQFKGDHPALAGMRNASMAQKYLQLPTDVAYIKHIRWFGPPNGTQISCKFGAEVKMWDPENALVVQDDFPRRPTKEPPTAADA